MRVPEYQKQLVLKPAMFNGPKNEFRKNRSEDRIFWVERIGFRRDQEVNLSKTLLITIQIKTIYTSKLELYI